MTTRQLLGTIGVDSATVMVGDPAYLFDDDGNASLPTWDEFTQRFFAGPGDSAAAQPLGEHLGLVVMPGYGDGIYPVYAEIDEHFTVHSLTIEFIPNDTQRRKEHDA